MMKIQKQIMTVFCILPLFSVGRIQYTASQVEPKRIADPDYNPEIENPAFPFGQGPMILIDEAHNNYHTSIGSYMPFAKLLEKDGYIIGRGKERIESKDYLETCDIFVIADAQPPSKAGDSPTFAQAEINELNRWVQNGGSLLLITDHMPDPAAIEKLARSFGIEVNNGYVLNNHYSVGETPMIFKRSEGSIADHPVTRGRYPSEMVRQIATFTGSAFKTDTDYSPLLIFKANKRSWMPEALYDFHEGTPNISVSGWFQGAVSNFGLGKIAFFSEAAMFTAQIFEKGKIQVGMNHPMAEDNDLLLLNVVHWMSGLL